MRRPWIAVATLVSGCQWEIVLGQLRAPAAVDAVAVDAVTDASDVTDVTGAPRDAPAAETADVRDAADVADATDIADATGASDAADVTDSEDVSADVFEEPMGTLTAVSLGGAFTCALRSDGSAWCWGANDRGQLGDGTTTDRATPRRVAGVSMATALAAGARHACVRLRDGSVWCWGANDHGQLGDGTTTDRRTPVRALVSAVDAVTAGGAHTCFLSGATVSCVGANDRGQLGDGTTADRASPTPVSGSFSAVRAGAESTCANAADGVRCWGANDRAQLGDGSSADRVTPTAVMGGDGHQLVAVGARHALSRGADGGVFVWGDGARGALGTGRSEVVPRATRVDAWQGVQVFAGDGFTCAVVAPSDMRCAGANDRGQLGIVDTTDRALPDVRIVDFTRVEFLGLSAGDAHACALVNDGTLWCWGANDRGQLAARGAFVTRPMRSWR